MDQEKQPAIVWLLQGEVLFFGKTLTLRGGGGGAGDGSFWLEHPPPHFGLVATGKPPKL